MDTKNPVDDLYPELPPEQRAEALDHLERYVELVCRIYEAIKDDPVKMEKIRRSIAEQEASEKQRRQANE